MSQEMINAIVIAAVAVIVVAAIKGSISHFKGEGGCCGGGGSSKKIKPRKLSNVVSKRTMIIEGMVCDNCSTRVQNALNSIDGVSAKVNRSKNQAIIETEKNIDDQVLEKTVTDMGYTVKEIC